MNGRYLVVLADGAQAAFCAGVVGELARRGVRWEEGAGAGLGAWLALLGVLGEGEELERRFFRMGEFGAPLFSSLMTNVHRKSPDNEFFTLPDAFRLKGWLSGEVLAEFLEPELALVGKVTVWVALEDLIVGNREWKRLEQPRDLVAAAAFPWGWSPDERGIWGGVEACAEVPWPPLSAGTVGDLICGFPVPPVERQGLGRSLFFTSQRRGELVGAKTVARWLRQHPGIRLWAPSEMTYRTFAQRPTASVGVEYPYPVEQNGELCKTFLAYGQWLVRSA